MKEIQNMKIRLNKDQALIMTLFLVLFSNAMLRTEEHIKLYIGVSLIICIYAIYRGLVKPSRISRTLVSGCTFWLVVLFSMYFIYGVVLTKYSYFDLDYFFFMFVMILITILLFIDVPFKDLMEILIKVCVFAAVAICLFILVNEWSIIISGGTRIGESGSGNVNTVAVYLGIMSIPCIYKVIFEKKYYYLLPYGLSTAIMLLTGSKKALVFIFCGLLMLSVLKNGIKLHKYILQILLAIVLLSFVLNNDFLYNIIGIRIIDFIGTLGFNIEGANISNSTLLRLMMYKLGYSAFLSKPLFGGGWFYFSYYSGLGTYSHNNYLELLVTYGVLGFSIYYSMFIIVLARLKKIIKVDNHAKLLFTMLIIILINDLAAVSFSYNILNYQVLVFGYLYLKGMRKEVVKKKLAKGGIDNEKSLDSY